MKIIFNFHFYIFHWHEFLSRFADKTTELAANNAKIVENSLSLRLKKFFIIFCHPFLRFVLTLSFYLRFCRFALTFLFYMILRRFLPWLYCLYRVYLLTIKAFCLFSMAFISIRYFYFYIPLYIRATCPMAKTLYKVKKQKL